MAENRHALVRGIYWILANGHDPEGNPWSMRSLSLAAGLSHSHVGQIVSGRVAPEDVAVGTIEALARVANVRADWLFRGVEPREPFEPAAQSVERDERYPNRAAAMAANEHRWSVAAAKRLASLDLKSAEDLTVEDWIKKGDAIEAEVRGKAVGVRVDVDEDPPIHIGRGKRSRR